MRRVVPASLLGSLLLLWDGCFEVGDAVGEGAGAVGEVEGRADEGGAAGLEARPEWISSSMAAVASDATCCICNEAWSRARWRSWRSLVWNCLSWLSQRWIERSLTPDRWAAAATEWAESKATSASCCRWVRAGSESAVATESSLAGWSWQDLVGFGAVFGVILKILYVLPVLQSWVTSHGTGADR